MLTLISGTNRPGSTTRKVVTRLESIYAALGQDVCVIDLTRLPLDLFGPAAYDEKPPSFQPTLDAVLGSSGLVVVTPEYNGGFPGVLKYFIDMLPFPESFEARPVCFVGVSAGQWGALRPVEQLQHIFGYRNAYVYPNRVFIANCEDVLEEATGRILDDSIDRRLQAQAVGFIDFVARLREVPVS
jgi:NAD(P)H-dependent FMN reductase